MSEPFVVQLERIRLAWAEFKRELWNGFVEGLGMRRFLNWLLKILTGHGVPKPGKAPRGTRWRWDVFEQMWVPTGDPGWHRFSD